MIRDNATSGMVGRVGSVVQVFLGSTIEENGENPDPTYFFSYLQGGVLGEFSTNLFVVTATIQNNTGPGPQADMNSNVRLIESDLFGNDVGLNVMHQSLAVFDQAESLPGPSMLSGNLPKDVECDTSSLVFGDMAGVGNNGCQNTEPDKKNK